MKMPVPPSYWIDRLTVSQDPVYILVRSSVGSLQQHLRKVGNRLFASPVFIRSVLSADTRKSLETAGIAEIQYRYWKGVCTVAGAVLGFIVYLLSVDTVFSPMMLLVPAFAAGAFILPDFYLADREQEIEYQIHTDFPRFLDLLHLYTASAAYENIGNAMHAVASSMNGPLGERLRDMTRLYRFVDVATFLDEMERRFAIPLARDLVSTLRLAETYGGSISTKIGALAEESHKERMQKARKAGQTASAALMVPLMIFHFPVAITIFLAPTALALKEAFGW
ncbi:MAG: type II secretion system F family protein [Patescibacteria group bacterium]|nr:type II secretion system F family protein [Patescibacteria group bacterium]